MSHHIASLGHPFGVGRADFAPATPHDAQDIRPGRAPATPAGDLSFFALRADHPASEPCRLLGELGLLAGNEAASRPVARPRRFWL